MTRLRPTTLRARFGLRAFLITLVVLEAATAVTGLVWRARTLDAVVEGVTTHLDSVEAGLLAEVEQGVEPLSSGAIRILPSPEAGVQIVEEAGRVVAASEGLIDTRPLIPFDVVAASTTATTVVEREGYGRGLVEAHLVSLDGRRVAVEAVGDLDDVEAATRTTWLIAAGVLVLAAGIGVGVGVSVDRALKPVRAITARAEEMADGRRALRLHVRADTTELRDLSARLDHLLDVIRATLRREQRFLEDASHELRTPIAIAQAELDLARRNAPDDDTRAAAGSALEEVRRLDRISEDLLVLARTRALGTDGFAAVDLGDVARRSASTVRKDPRQRPVAIGVTGRASVVGDADALERALTNLLANAARACNGEVSVEITDAGDEARITVTDDGPGFPEDLLPRLFDRFSRSTGSSSGGTGLGTAIAAEVAAAHGGAIEAANRPTGGAVVTLRLPTGASQTRG